MTRAVVMTDVSLRQISERHSETCSWICV